MPRAVLLRLGYWVLGLAAVSLLNAVLVTYVLNLPGWAVIIEAVVIGVLYSLWWPLWKLLS